MNMEFKVDSSNFNNYLKNLPKNILENTEKHSGKIQYEIVSSTSPKVPIRSGKLISSHYKETEIQGNLYYQKISYSAYRDGVFDYAEIQHNVLGHFGIKYKHRLGGEHSYLKKGMMEAEPLVIKEFEKSIDEVFSR